MSRVKPVNIVPVLHSLEQVDATLAEISAKKRTVALIETSLNEDIDKLKLKAASQCESYKQEIASLEQAIIKYADYHKPDLFKVKKSVQLTFGQIGFRTSSKLKVLSKWTWERVLEALEDRGLTNYIRVKKEADKEALKGLAPEKMPGVGVKLVAEDVFFYELEEQELSAIQ